MPAAVAPGPTAQGFQGLIEPGNIDLAARPLVKNKDGSTSTVLSATFEADGKHILIPLVADDGKILKPEDAWKYFLKSGKHLGIFQDSATADAFAKSLHEQQSKFYGLSK